MLYANSGKQSGLPVPTSAHSTREDKTDATKVVHVVLSNKLLEQIPGRSYTKYKGIHVNPLWNWDKKKAIEWIKKKQRDCVKFKVVSDSDDEADEESHDETAHESDNDLI